MASPVMLPIGTRNGEEAGVEGIESRPAVKNGVVGRYGNEGEVGSEWVERVVRYRA